MREGWWCEKEGEGGREKGRGGEFTWCGHRERMVVVHV